MSRSVLQRLSENDPSLVKLDLSNSLTIPNFYEFQEAMIANTSVQKAVVDFQWLLNYLPRQEFQQLLQSVGKIICLEKLMIFDHGRTDIPMHSLISTMMPANKLKILDVVRLEFASLTDVEVFSSVLREHPTLERFSSHRLTLAGGVTLDPLFETLADLPNLKAVCLSFDWDLRNSYVRHEGALVKLCTSDSLQELKLWSRQLNDDCCVAIAKALRRNTALKTLDLQCQVIGNEGLEELTSMMEANYTIESVRTTGRRLSLSQKIDMYVRLNRVGRVLLVKEQASQQDWVDLLVQARGDLDALFYFIRANPTCCYKE